MLLYSHKIHSNLHCLSIPSEQQTTNDAEKKLTELIRTTCKRRRAISTAETEHNSQRHCDELNENNIDGMKKKNGSQFSTVSAHICTCVCVCARTDCCTKTGLPTKYKYNRRCLWHVYYTCLFIWAIKNLFIYRIGLSLRRHFCIHHRRRLKRTR